MRIVKNSLLVVIATMIPLIVGELVLRWLAPPPNSQSLFKSIPDSDMQILGNPMAEGLFSGAHVAINSLGLRDREYAMERVVGVGRIITLGDSFTFGQGVPVNRTYPKVTEAILNSSTLTRYTSFEVINFGMPGYNTLRQLAQLRELGLRLKPDIVVVGFLYDDVLLWDRDLLNGTCNPDGSSQMSDSTTSSIVLGSSRFKSWVNRTIITLKSYSLLFAYISPRVSAVVRRLGGKDFGQAAALEYQYTDENLNWLCMRNALLEMRNLGEEHDFELVVLIIPAMAKYDEETYPLMRYHKVVSAFCEANSIPYLDLLPRFWRVDASQFWITPTDSHPNADGHRLIGESLAQILLGILRRSPEGQ